MVLKNFIYLLLIFVLLTCTYKDGFFYYVGIGNTESFGGDDKDEVNAIATDKDRNIYLAGGFRNTVDFDPSAHTENKTALGHRNLYLSKINSDAIFEWVKTINCATADITAKDVVVDFSGNIYITGTFTDNGIDFNPNSGVDIHNLSGASPDVFLTSFDKNGDYRWTKIFDFDSIRDIEVDSRGNIYMLGNSVNRSHIFIVKISDEIRKVTFGETEICAYAMDVDNSGNIAISGFFNGDIDFNFNGIEEDKHSSNAIDPFITFIDHDFNYMHTETFNGNLNGTDICTNIVLDDGGDVFFTGTFNSSKLYLGNHQLNNVMPGDYDIFLGKYNFKSRKICWAKSSCGDNAEYVGGIAWNAGYVYITGWYEGNVNFNTDGRDIHSSAGLSDIFMSQWSGDGKYIKTLTFGGSKDDIGISLCTAQHRLYLTGMFEGAADFKIKEDIPADIHTSNGSYDVFYMILVP